MIGRRAFAALCLCLALWPSPALAADVGYPPPWPSFDITVTVPFNKGSEADSLFTLLRPSFEAATKRKMQAVYAPGRAGADGWARMVDDTPNGATVTIVVLPDAFLRSLQPDSGVSLDSMAITNILAQMPCVLWVGEPVSVASLDAFVDAAAGMRGKYPVTGPGRYSAGQIAARALDREIGVRTTYLPYVDSVSAAKAVLDRLAEAFWGYSVPVTVTEYPSAKIKALAVAGVERLPSMPDVPTFRELGLDVVQGVSLGLAVPAATPKITREEISEYFSAVAKGQTFRTQAARLGFVPLDVDMETMPMFIQEMQTAARRQASTYDLREQ